MKLNEKQKLSKKVERWEQVNVNRLIYQEDSWSRTNVFYSTCEKYPAITVEWYGEGSDIIICTNADSGIRCRMFDMKLDIKHRVIKKISLNLNRNSLKFSHDDVLLLEDIALYLNVSESTVKAEFEEYHKKFRGKPKGLVYSQKSHNESLIKRLLHSGECVKKGLE